MRPHKLTSQNSLLLVCKNKDRKKPHTTNGISEASALMKSTHHALVENKILQLIESQQPISLIEICRLFIEPKTVIRCLNNLERQGVIIKHALERKTILYTSFRWKGVAA